MTAKSKKSKKWSWSKRITIGGVSGVLAILTYLGISPFVKKPANISIANNNQTGGNFTGIDNSTHVGVQLPTTAESVTRWSNPIFKVPLESLVARKQYNYIGFLTTSHYAEIEQIALSDKRVKVADTGLRFGFASRYNDDFNDTPPPGNDGYNYSSVSSLVYATITLDPSIFTEAKSK